MIFTLFIGYLCCLFFTAHAQAQPVVVIVPSYNNAATCINNLESILKQDYKPLHIIYIDDCSTDRTGIVIQDYIRRKNLESTVTLIRNSYNRKAMANIYNAVHLCDDHCLITIVDGDDALAHNRVIATIVEKHQKHDAWISYAQFINVPEARARALNIPVKGYAQAMPQTIVAAGTYRKHPWCWSGLRSFYAWIFKQIKLNDLLDTRPFRLNKFFGVCCDNAYFFPLLEMSGPHALFIPDVLLLRNVETPLNDFKINRTQQSETARLIRSMKPYQRLYEPIADTERHTSFDAVIVPANSQELLQSLERFHEHQHVHSISVITDNFSEPLDSIQKYESEKLHLHTYQSFRSIDFASTHLLIIDGTLSNTIDLKHAAELLQQTCAHAYYFDIKTEHFGSRTLHELPIEICADKSFAFRFNTKNICRYNATHRHQILVRTQDIAPLVRSEHSVKALLQTLNNISDRSGIVCLAQL